MRYVVRVDRRGFGLCATCYTLKRQDDEYYGGHREEVLARDGYRCRIPGCSRGGTTKRTLAVHHREPGNSDPALMITLCLAHHAMVTRTWLFNDVHDCWLSPFKTVQNVSGRVTM